MNFIFIVFRRKLTTENGIYFSIEKAISMNFNEEPDLNTHASFSEYVWMALDGPYGFCIAAIFSIQQTFNLLIIWSIIAFLPHTLSLSLFLSLISWRQKYILHTFRLLNQSQTGKVNYSFVPIVFVEQLNDWLSLQFHDKVNLIFH